MTAPAESTTSSGDNTGIPVLRYLPGLALLVVVGVVGTFAQTGLRSVGKATGTALPDIEYVLWAIILGL
ncbi:MAG: hypothetical protein QOK26_2380, partial [Pseudonocardiales bacterium]|nr:hypothetical protein [Pseudonocardiales bacterium]